MNNLVNKNFVIDKETGDIRISQKKCAEILGISQSTLSRYIINSSPITFFSLVKHFALNSKNKKSAHVLEYIISCKNFTLNELESDDFKTHMLKFNSKKEGKCR